ncbi:helix-turn-helix domain-containing protein [Zophobihabitans entericus]|uniref:Helix-turn-helix domain-containing protein n=1 Tax=Zophobihabitans entericus TaxID=1635327 RepID=A0A6G9IAJ5_9GAMM|nr:helix-turn-helix domain-containing protein [Zophobihabitans entericus]QIQ20744.1 helix-turn-helix domain-containing protein [Zophobihabitans entericus]
MDETTGNEQQVVTLGERLVQLRKQANLSQDEIASRLHIRKAMIADIEEDKEINIPTVFIRGYIKAYAKAVNLPDDELKGYLGEVPTHVTAPMRNFSNKEQRKRSSKRLLVISSIILIIILGVTGFFIWQEYRREGSDITRYAPSAILQMESVES